MVVMLRVRISHEFMSCFLPPVVWYRSSPVYVTGYLFFFSFSFFFIDRDGH